MKSTDLALKYKNCLCTEDAWEEIVVKDDENYQLRTVIYYHCMDCGIDFRVQDFDSGEEVIMSH